MNRKYIGSLGLLLLASALISSANGGDKATVGWVEKVRIHPGKLLVEARIDTGADTSSLHCDCITCFDRNGEKWVSFIVE